jgi:hypothetical protein
MTDYRPPKRMPSQVNHLRESGEQGFAERSLARSGMELAVGLHPRSVG